MLTLLSRFMSSFSVTGSANVAHTGYGRRLLSMYIFSVDADGSVVFVACLSCLRHHQHRYCSCSLCKRRQEYLFFSGFTSPAPVFLIACFRSVRLFLTRFSIFGESHVWSGKLVRKEASRQGRLDDVVHFMCECFVHENKNNLRLSNMTGAHL